VIYRHTQLVCGDLQSVTSDVWSFVKWYAVANV